MMCFIIINNIINSWSIKIITKFELEFILSVYIYIGCSLVILSLGIFRLFFIILKNISDKNWVVLEELHSDVINFLHR